MAASPPFRARPQARASIARLQPVATLTGRVEHGDSRGRQLGFPTANLTCEAVTVADGVWGGVARIGHSPTALLAAVSIGRRGTFYGTSGRRLVEVHLVDFSQDIYGEHLSIDLHVRLRSQRRFDGVDALVHQLQRDIDRVRGWATEGDRITPVKRRAHGRPTSSITRTDVPLWALRRTASVLERTTEDSVPDAESLARLAGISKGLAKRCLAIHTDNLVDAALP